MANYTPRTSEAAFLTPVSPSDYPNGWNPYPMYVLRDEVIFRDSDGNITGTGGTTVGAGTIRNINIADNAAISADKLVDGISNKVLTLAERQKLANLSGGGAGGTGTAVNDAHISDVAGQLLSSGQNSGIVFYYDPAVRQLVSTVTAQGSNFTVQADPTDDQVLLWRDSAATADTAYGVESYGSGAYGE